MRLGKWHVPDGTSAGLLVQHSPSGLGYNMNTSGHPTLPLWRGEGVWVVAFTSGRVDCGVAVVWGSTCGSGGGGGFRWGSARVARSGVRVGVGRGGCKGRRGAGVGGPHRGLPSREEHALFRVTPPPLFLVANCG